MVPDDPETPHALYGTRHHAPTKSHLAAAPVMDLALVVGHHPDAQGATLSLSGHRTTEYKLWSPFARELALTLIQRDVDVDVIHRPNPDPDSDLMHEVNHTGADLAVELHFNAASGRASGSEMLYWPGSPKGKAFAEHLQAETVDALGNEDRGAKPRSDLAFLEGTSMPAVIAEPFFGSSPKDAFRGVTRLPDLMQAYRTAILQALTDFDHPPA